MSGVKEFVNSLLPHRGWYFLKRRNNSNWQQW